MGSCSCVRPWTVALAFLNFSSHKKAGILLALLTSWVVPELSVSCVRLFVTPWSVARQAPLSMEFFQARILEQVAISSFRGIFLTQQFNPCLLRHLNSRRILYH